MLHIRTNIPNRATNHGAKGIGELQLVCGVDALKSVGELADGDTAPAIVSGTGASRGVNLFRPDTVRSRTVVVD